MTWISSISSEGVTSRYDKVFDPHQADLTFEPTPTDVQHYGLSFLTNSGFVGYVLGNYWLTSLFDNCVCTFTVQVIRLKANLTMGGRGLCCTHPVCSSTFDMVRSYRILVGGDGLMASGLCFFSQFYLVI